MKKLSLRRLVFMALCCDLGIFAKKLIVPAANLLTDFLHIPGGIGTGFSLMFVVVAAVIVPLPGAATLMGLVQSGIALCMGTVGSMGALAPVGYILPAAAIDLVLLVARRTGLGRTESIVLANTAASAVACLAANLIVFRLRGIVLALYLCVALSSGAVCGILANGCIRKLEPVLGGDERHEKQKHYPVADGAAHADRNTRRGASDNAHA